MKEVTITLYEYGELESITAKRSASEYIQRCLRENEIFWIDECYNQLTKYIDCKHRYTHRHLHDICYDIGICYLMDFCDQFDFCNQFSGESIINGWLCFADEYFTSLQWDESDIEQYASDREMYFTKNGKIWGD